MAYFEDRFLKQANKYYAIGDKSLKELQTMFKNTSTLFEKEINNFYAKYGAVISTPTYETLADGTKVISGTSAKVAIPAEKLTNKRIKKMEVQLAVIIKQLAENQNDYMKTTLGSIANDSYYDTIYEVYKGYKIGTSFNVLNPNLISQLIRHPVNGQAFSTRVWANRDKLANTVNQTLRAGLTQGISNQEMAKRLTRFAKVPAGKKSAIESAYAVSKRLVQTEVTNTYNQATKLGYEATGFVKQYEYLATLDSKTSSICSNLDGKIFNLADATVGLNYPPMHVNCRSTTVAHFDDSKQLLKRMARDVETGKNFTVPAKMTSNDFKDIYVNKTITRDEWDKR